MTSASKIEWTEATWNPVTGCTKISAGCKHCYAHRMAFRLHAMGNPRYANGFNITLHEDLVATPAKWKTPKMIFVNSMSDLFHPKVSVQFIQRVFETMNNCPQHTFQILTKRGDNLEKIAPQLSWTPNIWMGVSVENAKMYHRIDSLRKVPSAVRFLSCEPLLGPCDDLNLDGIHWVIVGGESGPKSRPMQKEWVLAIKKQCRAAKVPFFFKQWGGVRKDLTGRTLNGRTFDEFPRKCG